MLQRERLGLTSPCMASEPASIRRVERISNWLGNTMDSTGVPLPLRPHAVKLVEAEDSGRTTATMSVMTVSLAMTRHGWSGERRLGRSCGYSINRPGTCRGVAGLRQEAKQIRAIASKTHIACSRRQRVRSQRGFSVRKEGSASARRFAARQQRADREKYLLRKRAACGLDVDAGVRSLRCQRQVQPLRSPNLSRLHRWPFLVPWKRERTTVARSETRRGPGRLQGRLRDSRTVDCVHRGPLHAQQQVAASIETWTLGVEYMIVTCFGCA